MSGGVFAGSGDDGATDEGKSWGIVAAVSDLMAEGHSPGALAPSLVSAASVLLSAQMNRQQWLAMCDEMWSQSTEQLTTEPHGGV